VPLTLPTHPIVVVPLKLWRPRWFDGVALTLGAIAPDIAYAADGYGVTIHSHAWHAPLWWAIPLVLVGARLVRWAAPTIAAHLPAFGPLALRDYGALQRVRHGWFVTATSAVIGAASHVVLDAFSHPRSDGGRILFPVLHHHVTSDLPLWYLISMAFDLAGMLAAVAATIHIGRTRAVYRWHGPPPLTRARPGVFWSAVFVVGAGGLALLPLQPTDLFADQAVRCMLIGGLALLAGSAAVRISVVLGTPTASDLD
jgi:hypothetical protein